MGPQGELNPRPGGFNPPRTPQDPWGFDLIKNSMLKNNKTNLCATGNGHVGNNPHIIQVQATH